MPNTSIDSDAIDAAYRDKLRELYLTLVRNLIERPDSHGEQTSVELFTNGLNIARRARELALAAVDGPATVAALAAKAKKT